MIGGNQTKLLGLVILCAAISLAVLLPAMGVHEFNWYGATRTQLDPVTGEITSNQDYQRVHVLVLLGIAGMVGMAMWALSSGVSKEPAPRRRR